MDQARLTAEVRELKVSTNAIRRAGLVPAIVYGHKLETLPVKLSERNLRRILSSGGENMIINMELGTNSPETVIIKEVQIDPVSRQIIHADFMRVSLEERITTHVSIVLNGTAPGIEEGGILEFPHREIRVECQAGNIPEHITVDVSSLSVGDSIRVGDLTPEEGLVILDDPATTIVAIAIPTIHKEGEEEAEVVTEEEEKEPEVISEKRREAEEEE